MSGLHKRWIPFTAVPLLLATALQADVTILGQPGSYTSLQDAIDAATDGDVLLIEPGAYSGFTIDDKALTLLPDSPGPIQVNGLCKIVDLAPQRSVSIVGLHILAPQSSFAGVSHPGLTLESNAGHVRLQGCTFWGGKPAIDYGFLTPAGHGLRVIDCPQVIVTQCVLRGRDYGFASGGGPRAGGDGLHATNSVVALYGCEVRGGAGSEETYPSGGPGGAGIRVEGWGVFTSGSTLIGGFGGGGDYIGCTDSGDGGDALVVTGSQVRLLDSVLTPGAAGNFYTCNPGSPGQTVVNDGGFVQQVSGSARGLTGPVRTTDNATTVFVVTGQPGDKVWLLRSRRPGFQYFPALSGTVAIAYPLLMSIQPAGTIGAEGTLDVDLTLGDLVGPEAGWTWYVQALCSDSSGAGYLSNPLSLLVENT